MSIAAVPDVYLTRRFRKVKSDNNVMSIAAVQAKTVQAFSQGVNNLCPCSYSF